jgi:hypothetical protein
MPIKMVITNFWFCRFLAVIISRANGIEICMTHSKTTLIAIYEQQRLLVLGLCYN